MSYTWISNLFLYVLLFIVKVTSSSNRAFDFQLYKDVLDEAECNRQLNYIRNNDTLLRTRFIDASWRVPRGFFKGNTRDLGSYLQCLEISEEVLDMYIGGKYCAVQFPVSQENFEIPTIPVFPNITWPDTNITWPDSWNISDILPPQPESFQSLPWEQLSLRSKSLTQEMKEKMIEFENIRKMMKFLMFGGPKLDITPARSANIDLSNSTMSFELAICLPKVCTMRQALNFFSNNLTNNMEFDELFCRLPNDKTWVAADTVAIVIFSIIGLLTMLSTAYDIRHTVILEKDPQKANKFYQAFSVYTNTKNFFVFPSGPSVVTCLDGIRSIAMLWVIVGHTFATQFNAPPDNPLDMINFAVQFTSLWVTAAPITVDTFFLLSGLLVVYTTASKMSRSALLKNLHLFYLNRLLRMFPVLATAILVTASFLHRTADGPYFNTVAEWVDTCREKWWHTLLYVQNFLTPACIPHTWYLAIDMQLYVLSPLVLFWIYGQSRRSSWIALSATLIGVLIAASVYNVFNNYGSAVFALGRSGEDSMNYFERYYFHTLPRAAPFFVGMIFGYLLHIYKGKTIKMPMVLVLFLWVLMFATTSLVCVTHYWNMQVDWDNRLIDKMFNSYKRSVWVVCIGWLIFACHKGYGGPINWVLSLHVFKILGRLSYAMYIFHYPLMFLLRGTNLSTQYFTVHHTMYQFLYDFAFALIAAFLVTIFIDSPFANIIRLAMEGKRNEMLKKEKSSSIKTEPELGGVLQNGTKKQP